MNNIIKKLTIVSILSISVFSFSGCKTTINNNDDSFELIQEIDSRYVKSEIRDKKTGVHYYVNTDGIMCPVYNFNGSIKSTAEVINK